MRYLLSLVFLATFFCPSNAQEYKKYMALSYAELDSLTTIEYKKGAYTNAIPLIQAGRIKAKNEFGEQDSVFAEYTNNLGFFYAELGKFKEALQFYTQAKNIRAKVLGKEHPQFASSLNNLAALHDDMGEFDLALPLYLEAKSVRAKSVGSNTADYAQSLNNLASLYQKMGNFEIAVPLYKQAISIYGKTLGSSHPKYAQTLNNLAYLYQRMGDFEQALSLNIEARNNYEKAVGREHPSFANAMNNMASIYERMGDYDLALPLYIQTKDIFEKILEPSHPQFTVPMNNLAGLYYKMKEYNKALPLYIKSKDIREKVLGKNHPQFTTALNNLAALYKAKGNLDKALPLFIQAKDIRKRVLGETHPLYALSINNLASLYMEMGNYELALPLYIEAKNIRREILGKNHPDYAFSLNNLAVIHEKIGDWNLAWEYLGKAMNSSSGLNLTHDWTKTWADKLVNNSYASNLHLEEMIYSLSIAYSFLDHDTSVENSVEKQRLVSDLALALLSNQRNLVANESDKLRMLTKSTDWLQNSLKVLTPEIDISKAFNLSDQNKSVLLLQAIKSEAAYGLGEIPDSLVWQNKKLLKKQNEIQARLLERKSEETKRKLIDDLNQVNNDIDDFVKKIKKDYPKYHKLKYQQIDVKVEDIQKLIDDKTALLEYVISDSILHAFVIQKDKIHWHQIPVTATLLKNNIKKFHALLSSYDQIEEESRTNDYMQLAHWFFKTTLAEALKGLQEIDNLIIIPDGELAHLPFESFLTQEVNQDQGFAELPYLLKDYNISYNYSASLWKENKSNKKQENNGEIFALAANYQNKADSTTLRGRLPSLRSLRDALGPLPAARQEVEQLALTYRGYFGFDSLASERNLIEKIGNYAIIHLAMHGILDEKRPILSSLALTEDGDSLHDNFWQAHEISKMELNADLVVLSACETGFGRFEKGNGVASIARAFMYAGVPALVVSLWQVNDASTAIVMQNFYANLAKGQSKAAALRQAKLDYLQEAASENPIAAHPAFWSPFILIGDEEPIQIYQRATYNWFWWSIGIGIVLLIILLLFLAKRQGPSIA